ncbi:MAG: hypothetical protein AB1414_01930 [bacterium]
MSKVIFKHMDTILVILYFREAYFVISCYYQLRLSVIGYQVIGKEHAVACYLKLPITDYRLL